MDSTNPTHTPAPKGESPRTNRSVGKSMFLGADKEIFQRAKDLRNRETNAEKVLWTYLKDKPLGFKFRRQHPCIKFILDFYCHQLKLAIEVDGTVHDTESAKQNDKERQIYLQDNGISLIRFSNEDVEQNLEQVINVIDEKLKEMNDNSINDPQR